MHQRTASRNVFMHIPSKVKAYPSWRILYHGMEIAPNEEEHAKAMQELQAQIIE